jgi:single-stranded DNA-binding protein
VFDVIDALISGRLYGTPTGRTSSGGSAYVTAKVRVSTRAGECLFINVIAFADTATTALLALADGDAVALAGELTPKAYAAKDGTARPSVDLLAHSVLSEYHVVRKRKAVRGSDALPFDDELPGAA